MEHHRLHNTFLQSIALGGPLHDALRSAGGKFDAVLCPTQECLDALGITQVLLKRLPQSTKNASSPSTVPPSVHPATEFMLQHCIRFDDNGLGAQFTTLSGRRGTFSDMLDTVAIAGVIGKRDVLSHLEPLPGLTHEAHRSFSPESLNIFMIPDAMMDREVVAKIVSHAHNVAKEASLASDAPADSNFITKFFGGVASSIIGQASTSGGQPAAAVNQGSSVASSSGSGTLTEKRKKIVTEQELAIQYPEFQRLMLLSESSAIAKALHTFVDKCLLPPSQASPPKAPATRPSSSTPSSPSHSREETLFREIRSFTNTIVAQMMKLPAWKGKEVVAKEGVEKYISCKVYSKLFATNSADKQKDATLKRKLILLRSVVTAHHLDAIDGVECDPLWHDAVNALRQINEFRSPRDKLECGIKACKLIHQAIANTRARLRHDEKASAHVAESESVEVNPRNQSSHTSSPHDFALVANSSQSVVPHGVGLSSADDFLPSLMLCVLHANPDSFCSNLAYIDVVRDKNLLEAEGEYNLTSLQSAAEFWLTCQAPHLKMTEEEFDIALGNVFAVPSSASSSALRGSLPPATASSLMDDLLIAPVQSPPRSHTSSHSLLKDTPPLSPATELHEKLKVAVLASGIHPLLAASKESSATTVSAVLRTKDFDDITVGELKMIVEEARRLSFMESRITTLIGELEKLY